jgi:predicted NUDIX family phosphoesterase
VSRNPVDGRTLIPYNESKGLWKDILSNLRYPTRSEAERDNTCKQLVAYVVIKAGKSYLVYKRTKRSFEKRLRNKYSLGVGGHINQEDKNPKIDDYHENNNSELEFVLHGVEREVNEEIEIKSRILAKPKLIGFINDESNQVGFHHFGVVYLLEIEQPIVNKKGKGIERIDFRDVAYLKENRSKFESWSQILIDNVKLLV